MIQEYAGHIAIGAIVLGGSSIVAWITFWMKIGKGLADATDAKNLALLTNSKLAEFKVEVAKEYITAHELAEAEGRTAQAIESIRAEIRTLNDRLLQIITK